MSGSKADIKSLLDEAIIRLESVSDSARLDAEILLALSLGKSRSYLLAYPEQALTDSQLDIFQQYLTRRLTGEPIAHITGNREFWSLDLKVTADTLIPRPDTETLVEYLLEKFDTTKLSLADLGTGSGAIAIALASERPQWEITATDLSASALKIATTNACLHRCEQIQFIQSNWFDELKLKQFDIIVSNPPYIPASDIHLTQGDVRFDPTSALVSGSDGLDDLRLIIKQAINHLSEAGWLVVEHGYDQARMIRELFEATGFTHIELHRDYAGNPRFTTGQKPDHI